MSLKRIHELSDVKSFYDENGYLIIDDFISEFEANNLKYLLEKHASADYNNMLNMDRYEFLVAQSLEKIYKFDKISEKVDFLEVCKETSRVFRKLMFDKRLVDLVEFLYDEECISLCTDMIWKKAGTKYSTQSWIRHQDNYPKTHREGLSNVKKLGTGYGNPDKPGHLVEVDKNFKKYDVVGNVGTLYVQNGNLIHGSYPNKTKDKTRGMFSATYLPKGEKFLPGANSRRRVMNEV